MCKIIILSYLGAKFSGKPDEGASDGNMDDIESENAEKSRKVVSQVHLKTRLIFLRKLLFIINLQLKVIIMIASIFVYVHPVNRFVKDHFWFLFLCSGIHFFIVIALLLTRNKSPHRLIALSVFTISFSVTVGGVLAMSNYLLLLKIFALGMSIFGCYSFFTFQSRWEFKFTHAALFAVIWIPIVLLIMQFLLPNAIYPNSSLSDAVICGCLSLVYVWFSLLQIYRIFHVYKPSQYVQGVIDMDTDIVRAIMFGISGLKNTKNYDITYG